MLTIMLKYRVVLRGEPVSDLASTQSVVKLWVETHCCVIVLAPLAEDTALIGRWRTRPAIWYLSPNPPRVLFR